MERSRVNEVSGQIFQPVENSSGAVRTERGLSSSPVYPSQYPLKNTLVN